jgi:predicted Zn-dependent peptidase
VIVVAGDFEPAETLAWIEDYFGDVPAGNPLPEIDISEPRQEEEKFGSREDPLAPQPALAFGYQMPERGTQEYYAMAVLDQLLVQGNDSLLHRAIVVDEGYASGVFGGINLLGNLYNYNGPMLWTVGMIHGNEHDRDAIMTTVDDVIERLRTEEISEEELSRALTKLRSDFYGIVDSGTRFGLIDLLAAFALFDDDPSRINRIEEGFDDVTPALVLATAQEYLRPTNRSVLEVVPAPADGTGEEEDGQ